jgi:uncharacterized integral membrane protein
MFRGVLVPAGEHVVRLEYWPTDFGWHCAAAALGLLIIGGLLASRWGAARSLSLYRRRPGAHC